MNRQKGMVDMNEVQTVVTLESAKISCNFEQVEEAIKGILSE